jgi:hypothetical protein
LTILGMALLAPGIGAATPGDSAHDPDRGHHGSGHHADHGWGPTAWHAGRAGWSRKDGTRHATGHAYMDWDDCRGPVGLVIMARFQRHVDSRWVTTQTKVKRQGYRWDEGTAARDHELHFRPRFDARRADRTHRTRIKFVYVWRDGGELHERHRLRCALP